MKTFEKNQVVVREDGDFPKDALVVVGHESDGTLLAHPLGGGLQFRIPADEVPKFSVASDEEKTAIFSKAFFTLDGLENAFEGWTDGTLWNGFEKPKFDRETAVTVLSAMGFRWEFKNTEDSFHVIGCNDDDEPSVYSSELIALPDGGTAKVYGIGSGDWIWEKV